MKLTLKKIDDTAKDIKTFWFEPDKAPSYRAGQFIELHVPHADSDSRGQKRWFTLSSSPNEKLLSITTKFSAKGSTFKNALKDSKLGDVFMAVNPIGDFVLPADSKKPIVMLAGGIGVTPFRSMIGDLQKEENRDITLFYAVSDAQEFAFIDTFKSKNVSVVPVLSEPNPTWKGETGRLSHELLSRHIELTSDTLFYISGPGAMVKGISEALINHGITSKQIIKDYFPGY